MNQGTCIYKFFFYVASYRFRHVHSYVVLCLVRGVADSSKCCPALLESGSIPLPICATVQYDVLASFPVLHYSYCFLSGSSATRTASDISCACLTKSSDLLSTVNVQVHVHSNLSFLAAGHTQDKINLCSSDKDSEAHNCVRSHVRI